MPVGSERKAIEGMQHERGLPGERETGLKLVRRSMADIAGRRIGDERWNQDEMMLGHRKASTRDLYALFDPANLGSALLAPKIIDDIGGVFQCFHWTCIGIENASKGLGPMMILYIFQGG